MRQRRARREDAAAIHQLIAYYAAQGLLLPRTEEEVRSRIHHFLLVEEEEGQLAGCVALESYGPDLAEIRSLAVIPEMRGRGLGACLVSYALVEARRKNIARVFAVTPSPELFLRRGFALSARRALPEKMARDCRACPKSPACNLAAVIITVPPARAALTGLDASASPAPAA